ncbi:hypothetical protein [Commensalibacter papalotli (ex Botero et al. 2024)]|uniref:hypothetical protein n=1 Tax=Commensalibacter papalotli (ex Botero et al. 2024) TaxID=2972766 RepID=UPI0022FF4E91|nr:hypothetical protein [Commensalibacter papalotli (ex Botero et al. 2024)]CAI3958299.1 unnamed protein product [Commensalibacter papalotli (ex Botero et al. 2024)]
MTDQPQSLLQKYLKLKKQEVITCPICGCKTFEYESPANPISQDIISPPQKKENFRQEGIVPFYWMSCFDCGNSIFFPVGMVEKCLYENGTSIDDLPFYSEMLKWKEKNNV